MGMTNIEMSQTMLSWIQCFPQSITQQIDTQHRQKNCQARKNRHPPGAADIGTAVIEHCPPFRRRRLDTQPQITQPGCRQDANNGPTKNG